jgi:hypothetical protein
VRFIKVFLFSLLLALAIASCREKGGKFIDQGEIHYAIEYVGYVGVMPVEILPKTAIVSFKKDKILFEMTGIGKSGILNLSNPETGVYDTYYSLLTSRYFYAAAPGEIYPGFEAMEGMEIKKTSKTAVICGFNCKNAQVTFPADRKKPYDIWFTDEINVKNPNAFSPFKEIDGVLMSFFFFLGPSELHFTAETVYKKDVPDETFNRKDKYIRISREDITKLINQMKNL